MPLTNKMLKDPTITKIVYAYRYVPTDEIAYIGITTRTLAHRDEQHRSNTGRGHQDRFHCLLRENRKDFRIRILEIIDGDATGREDYWIKQLRPWNKTNEELFKAVREKAFTPEAIRKGAETRSRLYRGENNPRYGKKMSLEARKKLSEARKGMKFTPEHCANLGKALKGKFVGGKSPCAKAVIQMDLAGNELQQWACVSDAVRELGIGTNANVIACCKGKRKSAGGYRWSYS